MNLSELQGIITLALSICGAAGAVVSLMMGNRVKESEARITQKMDEKMVSKEHLGLEIKGLKSDLMLKMREELDRHDDKNKHERSV